MFTGLVEGCGTVTSVAAASGQLRLGIRPHFAWEKPLQGESVAVNGACLSVEGGDGFSFRTYASAETLACTMLGSLSRGDEVNLERALSLGDRLGGHLVSGHVDTIAHVNSVSERGASHCCRFSFPEEWSRQVITKGSVTLGGISLTVNACGPGWLEVNIIPETWNATVARNWQPGQPVNMETDMLGKYVGQMLVYFLQADLGIQQEVRRDRSRLSLEFLREHGF